MEQEGPITVVVRHRVKLGKEAEFEEWRRGISQAAAQFAGHLGCTVIRPAPPSLDYIFLFRFDTLDHLRAWEESDTRHQWLTKLDLITAEMVGRERHTGMEVWFTPPPGRMPPPRYKMVAVTMLGLYPLVMLVQLTLGPQLASWPLPLRTLVSAVLLVVLMTYLAMPLLTRLFARWLYGAPPHEPAADTAKPKP